MTNEIEAMKADAKKAKADVENKLANENADVN